MNNTTPKEQVLFEIECAILRVDLDVELLRQGLLKIDDKQQVEMYVKQIDQLNEGRELLHQKKKNLLKRK